MGMCERAREEERGRGEFRVLQHSHTFLRGHKINY